MNRPAPRRSPLAGRSALTPPPPPAEVPEVPEVPVETPHLAASGGASGGKTVAPAPVKPKTEKKPKPVAEATEEDSKKERVIFYLPPTDNARLRNLVKHLPVSMTEFLGTQVMETVAKYEKTHNNGEPFPDPSPGVPLRPGRRMS